VYSTRSSLITDGGDVGQAACTKDAWKRSGKIPGFTASYDPPGWLVELSISENLLGKSQLCSINVVIWCTGHRNWIWTESLRLQRQNKPSRLDEQIWSEDWCGSAKGRLNEPASDYATLHRFDEHVSSNALHGRSRQLYNLHWTQGFPTWYCNAAWGAVRLISNFGSCSNLKISKILKGTCVGRRLGRTNPT